MPLADVGTSVSAIIVRGESVHCDAEVRTWHLHKLRWRKQPRETTRAIVNRWSGSEHGPAHLYASLSARDQSVQFAIDAQGVVWQFADADMQCLHTRALGAHFFAVGVMLICRGNEPQAEVLGVTREVQREHIHGLAVTYAAPTEDQVRATIALNDALCSAYGLPLRVPIEGDDVFATALLLAHVASYRGVLGHLHLDERAVDPGLDLLRAIHGAGISIRQ